MSTVSSGSPRISVLVPVFNNESTLEPLCARLDAALAGTDYEVLLVNDGSRDGSLVTLKRLAAANLRLKVISLSKNFGQHPAIAAALDYATGEILVLMDADLEDQPEHVPRLVRTLRESGCDIVYTTKTGDQRRLTSDFYHAVFSRIVGVQLPRDLGTFRAFTGKVREALRAFPERHVLYGPLMFYIGFTYVIVPAERGEARRRSSYTFGKRLRMAVNSLVTYSDLPPKIFATFGFAVVFLSLMYSLIIVWQYLALGQQLPRGLTVVVLLVSFLSGMIMLAIGVVGAYVFRIFQEVLARPRYLVDEAINAERLPAS